MKIKLKGDLSYEELEDAIDKNGLDKVLNVIADICALKAEHLEENWQDKAAALKWDKASDKVGECAASSAVRGVSR